MVILEFRLTNDDYFRLKAAARQRGISVNRMIKGVATQMAAEIDLERQFVARAERGKGKVKRGLELLDRDRIIITK
jgi:uncharacterized protein (DUF1778 family)